MLKLSANKFWERSHMNLNISLFFSSTWTDMEGENCFNFSLSTFVQAFFPHLCIFSVSNFYTIQLYLLMMQKPFPFWLSPGKYKIVSPQKNLNKFFCILIFHHFPFQLFIESRCSAWSFGNVVSRYESSVFPMYGRTWWIAYSPLLLGETGIGAHCYRNCEGKIARDWKKFYRNERQQIKASN